MSSATSPSCGKIIGCHRLKGKVEQLDKINNKLIKNEELKQEIFEIKRELRDLTKEIYANWMEIQEEILNESGLNDKNKKVMQLDLANGGELIVHYSDNLVV